MTDHWTWPRKAGKAIVQRILIDAQLRRGDHVHQIGYYNHETCQGGDSDCQLWGRQLQEAMEKWQHPRDDDAS